MNLSRLEELAPVMAFVSYEMLHKKLYYFIPASNLPGLAGLQAAEASGRNPYEICWE